MLSDADVALTNLERLRIVAPLHNLSASVASEDFHRNLSNHFSPVSLKKTHIRPSGAHVCQPQEGPLFNSPSRRPPSAYLTNSASQDQDPKQWCPRLVEISCTNFPVKRACRGSHIHRCCTTNVMIFLKLPSVLATFQIKTTDPRLILFCERGVLCIIPVGSMSISSNLLTETS